MNAPRHTNGPEAIGTIEITYGGFHGKCKGEASVLSNGEILVPNDCQSDECACGGTRWAKVGERRISLYPARGWYLDDDDGYPILLGTCVLAYKVLP